MDQNNMPVTREEKMTVWDRRVALLEYLQENERATVDELMNELNVSRQDSFARRNCADAEARCGSGARTVRRRVSE